MRTFLIISHAKAQRRRGRKEDFEFYYGLFLTEAQGHGEHGGNNY